MTRAEPASRAVRIANCSGFFGDRLAEKAIALIQKPAAQPRK